jgi:hypothetical protein
MMHLHEAAGGETCIQVKMVQSPNASFMYPDIVSF